MFLLWATSSKRTALERCPFSVPLSLPGLKKPRKETEALLGAGVLGSDSARTKGFPSGLLSATQGAFPACKKKKKRHFRFNSESSVMDGGEGSAPQPGGLPALLLQVFVAVWEVGLLLFQKAAAHLTK